MAGKESNLRNIFTFKRQKKCKVYLLKGSKLIFPTWLSHEIIT